MAAASAGGGVASEHPAAAPAFVFERAARAATGVAEPRSEAPELFFTASGQVVLLAVVGDGTKSALAEFVSADGGDSFARRRDIVAASTGLSARGENRPQFTAEPDGAGAYGVWQATAGPGGHHSGGGTDGPLLRFVRAPLSMHDPLIPVVLDGSTRRYEGTATVAVSPDGIPHAAWIAPDENGFGVFVARSQDGGQTFGLPVRVGGGVCDCCRPSLAFGKNGAAYLGWRGVFAGDQRDVTVAASHDGGASWAPPVRVSSDGWSVRGCPNSGPALSVAGDTLHVVWFTLGSAGRPQLRAASSPDGTRFNPAHVVSGTVLDPNHPRFVAGPVPFPILVFEGRDPAGAGFGQTRPFLIAYRNGTWSRAQAVPADPAGRDVGDVTATMRDRSTIFVAATARDARGAAVEIVRGRLR